MENKAKIRINLNTREFEIEGTEEFINSHSEKIDNFLELLKKTPPPQPTVIQQPATTATQQIISPPIDSINAHLPETFGEYYHNMPKSAKDSDKMLVAGYFSQSLSTDNSFGTKEASSLLLEQGVKLSNPSMFLNQNTKPKYLIKLSKGKFRVSKLGLEYIEKLFADTSE
jgi:hypothetical protein